MLLLCSLLTWESTRNGWRHWGFFGATWIYVFPICPRISGTLERFFHVAWDFGQAKIFFFFPTFIIYAKLLGNIKIPKLPVSQNSSIRVFPECPKSFGHKLILFSTFIIYLKVLHKIKFPKVPKGFFQSAKFWAELRIFQPLKSAWNDRAESNPQTAHKFSSILEKIVLNFFPKCPCFGAKKNNS